MKDKEIFEKGHLIFAIQNHIPNAVIVENSFFEDQRSNDHFCTLYLEIEKNNGEKFSNLEITKLRKTIPDDILDGIEQLMHTVFMPRNEEEIMRNILNLSAEIKYLHDLPQIMIIFDEQTYSKLSFTIIVVRVVKPGGDSIQELFAKNETFLDHTPDRCKTIGYLRSKYIKEATVFNVKVDKEKFIRRDHSIDLNKARQAIVFELLRVIGEFRDFNGGMIFKQNKLLSEVKLLLGGDVNLNELLFENFFFSLMPIVMRTVLEPEALKTLFLMLKETIDMPFAPDNSYVMHLYMQPSFVFMIVKSEHRLSREEMIHPLNVLQAKSSEIATAYTQVHDLNYYGYIFRSTNSNRRDQFESIVRNVFSKLYLSNEARKLGPLGPR